MNFILLTKANCPNCETVKKKLFEKNIKYESISILNKKHLDDVLRKYKCTEKVNFLPILIVDFGFNTDPIVITSFDKIVERINSLKTQVNGRELMSESKFMEAYSRWNDKENRYETWEEACERVTNYISII